ncbi:sensor histidine kinase [Tersicoccus phoenicis]|uniref:sensor histidine kinase n=1 Tax=Tersicoccus phoenicis TaxID=554083 RepID=UPI001C44DD47|nr:sensor histidine kinase [Tersicoccus phoenicis]
MATAEPDRAGSSLSRIPVALAVALHVLVVALCLVIAVNAPTGGFAAVELGVVAVFLAVWFTGVALARARPAGDARRSAAARVWLGALTAAWLVLIVVSQEAIYLAFPLFFVLLQLLPGLRGVLAVAAATVVAVVAFARHRPDAGFAGVLGPVIGAAVAVVIANAYRALLTEIAERQQLIEDLTATRAALVEAERSAGVEAERARLAREIHDTVSQSLSSIIMLLHAADRAPESARAERVGQARQAAQDALAETRQFIAELQPAALHGRGVATALTRLADRTRAQSGLAVTLTLPPDLDDLAAVPTPVEVGLLRVAQNAVANVVQHAWASRLDITLSRLEGQIVLDVVDDGVGFDVDAVFRAEPAQPDDRMSFGLRGVRDRVAALGGDLIVESGPGEGTSVVALFEVDR